MQKIIVKAEFNNTRLDAFLVKFLKRKKATINKLIEKRLITINDDVNVKNGYLLKTNDELIINEEIHNEFQLIKSNRSLEIIYEDDYLVVVNKPKNMLTHPTTFNEQDTLVNVLLNKVQLGTFEDKHRPGIVHRLDRNTTGLIVVAKDLKTYKNLIKQIVDKVLIRKYLALVHHRFKEDHLLLKLPIIRSKTHPSKMTISDDANAKEAITEINVLKNFHFGSLIECLLHTGRTHQIRVHLAYIHHPVFNDSLYGSYDGYKDYEQFLHAHYLSFMHPITNKILEFRKEPDEIFISLEKKLEKKQHV